MHSLTHTHTPSHLLPPTTSPTHTLYIRENALSALSSLLDSSYPNVRDGDDVDTPQMAVGPILEAISDWIIEPCVRVRQYSEKYRSKGSGKGSGKGRSKNEMDEDERDKLREMEQLNMTEEELDKERRKNRKKGIEKRSETQKRSEKEREKERLKEIKNQQKLISTRNLKVQEPRGLAHLLMGAAYTAGINLLTGNFSALSVRSDTEVNMCIE